MPLALLCLAHFLMFPRTCNTRPLYYTEGSSRVETATTERLHIEPGHIVSDTHRCSISIGKNANKSDNKHDCQFRYINFADEHGYIGRQNHSGYID